MKKVLLLAIAIVFIFSFLFACQTKTNDEKLSINSDFKSITISEINGITEIAIEDKKSIKAFRNILLSAVKEPGAVNIIKDPDFYMKFIYDNNKFEGLYLWIGEEGLPSVFMTPKDSHTIYTVSKKETEKLIKLVKSRFN